MSFSIKILYASASTASFTISIIDTKSSCKCSSFNPVSKMNKNSAGKKSSWCSTTYCNATVIIDVSTTSLAPSNTFNNASFTNIVSRLIPVNPLICSNVFASIIPLTKYASIALLRNADTFSPSDAKSSFPNLMSEISYIFALM